VQKTQPEGMKANENENNGMFNEIISKNMASIETSMAKAVDGQRISWRWRQRSRSLLFGQNRTLGGQTCICSYHMLSMLIGGPAWLRSYGELSSGVGG